MNKNGGIAIMDHFILIYLLSLSLFSVDGNEF